MGNLISSIASGILGDWSTELRYYGFIGSKNCYKAKELFQSYYPTNHRGLRYYWSRLRIQSRSELIPHSWRVLRVGGRKGRDITEI